MRFVPTKLGTKRVKRFFAFLPVTLNQRFYGNKEEVRWLTWVTVEQVRYRSWWGAEFWDNTQFIDDLERYNRIRESVQRVMKGGKLHA